MSTEAAVSEMTQAPPSGAAAGTAEFEFQLTSREVSFSLDESIYPRDAIFGAAYLFIDRCYAFLTRPADGKVGVRLRPKGESDEAKLEALAGEFANELLNQVLRARIGRATSALREQYMARAFFSGRRSNETIASLLAELDAEELEEAPLDIPVPWEDAKSDKAEPGDGAVEADG